MTNPEDPSPDIIHTLHLHPDIALDVYGYFQNARKSGLPVDAALEDMIGDMRRIAENRNTDPKLAEAQHAANWAKNVLGEILDAVQNDGGSKGLVGHFIYDEPVHKLTDELLSSQLGVDTSTEEKVQQIEIGEWVVQRVVAVHRFEEGSPWDEYNDKPYGADYLLYTKDDPDLNSTG